MTDLKSLVKELAVNMKRASVDLETVPWQTRASITNMKKEAEEKVKGLKADYFRRVRSNTLGLFVFGEPDRVKAFTEIAAEEAGVVAIDGGLIFDRLADSIEPTLGASREFGPAQYQRLISGLQEVKSELDIRSMIMPQLDSLTAINSRAELVRYIRGLVTKAVGDDLTRLFVDQQINRLAVGSEFAGSVFPVAVTGLDRDEVAALVPLFTNSISVEVGTSKDGEVNKEYVLNQLTSLKGRLKGKSNN